MAPSGSNSQPWLFKITGSELILMPNYARIRTAVDPNNRELFISLGAVAKNIEIAAAYFGMEANKTEVGDKLIFIFSKSSGRKKTELFEYIPRRHTGRGEFEKKEIANLEELKESGNDNIQIIFFQSHEQKNVISEIIYKSELIWFKNKSLIKDLEKWLRDDIDEAKDGVPTGILNLYKFAVETKYLFSRDSQAAIKKARMEKILAREAPVIGVIVSREDQITSWIRTGEMYQEMALKLTREGAAVSFFNTVMELKGQRDKLAQILKIDGYPQLLFRAGYPVNSGPPSPRIPIEEMMVE